ncbi:hypothetical protein [Falsihalocynthiibacter sp. CO-5D18]|uniref:hypothetical protein n=1 Tax=Falsihalocynthiibacter sp. CO-5D18 TaxID=3240872 RepID=UPI00350F43AC
MKRPINYDEAVQKIYDRIADHKKANLDWNWQDSTDDKSILRSILSLKGAWYLENDRAFVFEKSLSDRTYYDMLRYTLAEKIYRSLKLEADEAAWAAEALAGEHDTPTYSSRAYTAHDGVRKFGLHTFVANCVHVLRLRGLNHHPACDAVAKACAKHNLDIRSAHTVNDIWKKYKPQSYRRERKDRGS